MVLTFFQRPSEYGGAHPVYVVAEGVQGIEYVGDWALKNRSKLRMIGGPDIEVNETQEQVLEKLAEVLPQWRGFKLASPIKPDDDGW